VLCRTRIPHTTSLALFEVDIKPICVTWLQNRYPGLLTPKQWCCSLRWERDESLRLQKPQGGGESCWGFVLQLFTRAGLIISAYAIAAAKAAVVVHRNDCIAQPSATCCTLVPLPACPFAVPFTSHPTGFGCARCVLGLQPWWLRPSAATAGPAVGLTAGPGWPGWWARQQRCWCCWCEAGT
jgi:hypothetical protein